jgi:hypothetical protein
MSSAFGMQFIATSVLAMAEAGTFGAFPIIKALARWAKAKERLK